MIMLRILGYTLFAAYWSWKGWWDRERKMLGASSDIFSFDPWQLKEGAKADLIEFLTHVIYFSMSLFLSPLILLTTQYTLNSWHK